MEIDFSPREKNVIEDYFKEPAIYLSQTNFKEGRLIFWKNAETLPSMRACSFMWRDGKVLIPNSSDNLFKEVLLEVSSEIKDIDQWTKLIEKISPELRRCIKVLAPYMTDIRDSWHPPAGENGQFEAYFDNSSTGRLEKISMLDSVSLFIRDVGAGLEFHWP